MIYWGCHGADALDFVVRFFLLIFFFSHIDFYFILLLLLLLLSKDEQWENPFITSGSWGSDACEAWRMTDPRARWVVAVSTHEGMSCGMEGFVVRVIPPMLWVDQNTHPKGNESPKNLAMFAHSHSPRHWRRTGYERQHCDIVAVGWLVVLSGKVGPNHTAQAEHAVINNILF